MEQGLGRSRKAGVLGLSALQSLPPATLSAAVRADLVAVAGKCGYVLGPPMRFTEADSGQVNPGHDHQNCAVCVAVYELRRRGLAVQARHYDANPASGAYQLGEETRLIWRTAQGHLPPLEPEDS